VTYSPLTDTLPAADLSLTTEPARPRSPAVADAIARRDARRFCEAILPEVSRTFALGIRVLPGTLGRAVLVAYLICRIADTVEDAPAMSPAAKAMRFDALLASLDRPDGAGEFVALAADVTGEAAHVTLVRHADLVVARYAALPARTRQIVARWVREMVLGMRKFVSLYPAGLRIRTLDEFREYCYYVAGTVGHMLTDLWREHSAAVGPALYARLHERSREFGEALQTVNILKDIAHDAEVENAIYLPEALLRERGGSHATLLAPEHAAASRATVDRLVTLAAADLDAARDYLLLLPRRALSIRLFCLLPVLFAHATLRELTRSSAMLRPGGVVKIPRREVRALLGAAVVVAGSNAGVRWLIDRVRRGR